MDSSIRGVSPVRYVFKDRIPLFTLSTKEKEAFQVAVKKIQYWRNNYSSFDAHLALLDVLALPVVKPIVESIKKHEFQLRKRIREASGELPKKLKYKSQKNEVKAFHETILRIFQYVQEAEVGLWRKALGNVLEMPIAKKLCNTRSFIWRVKKMTPEEGLTHDE